jgi:hypothetical protein
MYITTKKAKIAPSLSCLQQAIFTLSVLTMKMPSFSYHDTHFTMIYKIAKALNVPIDSFAIDFEEDNSNIFLSTIKSDVENMSKKQLDMLRDSIETIKKYEF